VQPTPSNPLSIGTVKFVDASLRSLLAGLTDTADVGTPRGDAGTSTREEAEQATAAGASSRLRDDSRDRPTRTSIGSRQQLPRLIDHGRADRRPNCRQARARRRPACARPGSVGHGWGMCAHLRLLARWTPDDRRDRHDETPKCRAIILSRTRTCVDSPTSGAGSSDANAPPTRAAQDHVAHTSCTAGQPNEMFRRL
jgi:hypothetical protein